MDALSAAGIPIYASPGRNGGIELDKNFILSKSLLSQEEKQQILQSLQGLASVNGFHYTQQLMIKLSALFQMRNPNWIEVDFNTWQSQNKEQELFDSLKEAICCKQVISFCYFSSQEKMTQRKAKPVRLVFKGQNWYLYAYCLLRQDFRFFKLSRLKKLKLAEETFEDDFSDLVIEKKLNLPPTVHLSLKFDRKLAFRVYDEFLEVKTDTEGDLYAELDIPDSALLDSYILSFGDAVEVLEPAFIRQRITEKLGKILKRYKS